MMPSEVFLREENQQCAMVLAVLAEAGCPGLIPPGETAAEAWVLLRPTLQALWVPRRAHRWVEAEVRHAPQRYPWWLYAHPETSYRYLFVALRPFLLLAGYQGRHPVCLHYCDWQSDVMSALMHHGWYDPTTGHAPPPGQELDAVEMRERGRDMFNGLMPGLGDAVTGHGLQTEEGRRMLWYRVVDEDGHETFINGMDMPNEDDEEDED
jgi:hypothetical protein